jgi:myo-inositol-1(or 4)-monophosphatase
VEKIMSAISPDLLNELAGFARSLAAAAGEAILPHFRQPISVDNKAMGAFDPVTIADRNGETAMRELIEAHFPDHGILGEEHGHKPSRSGFEWVLDPVDGTRSFIMGIPLWTTLIGLTFEGQSILGLMHQPYIGESFSGSKLGSYWHRGDVSQKITTKPAKNLSSAKLMTVAPEIYKTTAQKQILERLTSHVRLARYGADAYAYCLLAQGQLDIALDAGLESYDIAALVPIIENAGGVVSTFDGKSPLGGGDIIAAASPELHAEALTLIGA